MPETRAFPPMRTSYAVLVIAKHFGFGHLRPPVQNPSNPCPAPRCGAVWAGVGRLRPAPLSCTIFDPSVLVGTSSIFLALPQAAKLTHFTVPPLQTTTAALGRGLVLGFRHKAPARRSKGGDGLRRHPAQGKPTQGHTGGSLGRYASTMCQPFSLHSPFLLYGVFVILLVYSYCSVTGGGGSS